MRTKSLIKKKKKAKSPVPVFYVIEIPGLPYERPLSQELYKDA